MCRYPDKHPYPSRAAARKGIRALYSNRAAGLGRLVAYACGGHWHIGHKRGGK